MHNSRDLEHQSSDNSESFEDLLRKEDEEPVHRLTEGIQKAARIIVTPRSVQPPDKRGPEKKKAKRRTRDTVYREVKKALGMGIQLPKGR